MRSTTLRLVLVKHRSSYSSSMHSAAVLPLPSAPVLVSDVFDTPYRFGEPAKLLGFTPSRSRRPVAPAVPLPEALIYEGPSTGQHKARPRLLGSRILTTSLPAPEIFDGPAAPRRSHFRAGMLIHAPSQTPLPPWAMRIIFVMKHTGILGLKWRQALHLHDPHATRLSNCGGPVGDKLS
ncbi:hypothetical protein FA95DRAFT_1677461 [Auriscalpium vulgare]|uniref:Uncharacterized protein n=1 Tax=Auriscalpium vulgare TaxID=40419 RepID=A0ACB8RZ76_9AGAM|nr:hypothetical protein FA95DRAFT_1677461 [Auriscalpium vulgare]